MNLLPVEMGKYARLLQGYERCVVRSDDPTKCWGWNGAKIRRYGNAQGSGHGVLAHRLSYEMHVGRIPDGMNVLHRCDNPPCSNPAHLFLGTQADNIHDMISKRRHKHRLTDDVVREIRSRIASGERQSVIARSLGLSQTSVSEVKLDRRRLGLIR